MKNKKGFTLTELLAVIVILGIVLTLAIPSVLYITQVIKDNMYKTKLEMIEKAAQMYGQDNSDFIDGNTKITIKKLIESDYVDADDDNGNSIDPRNNRYMNCDEVEITIKTYSNGNIKVTVKADQIQREDPKFEIMNDDSCS